MNTKKNDPKNELFELIRNSEKSDNPTESENYLCQAYDVVIKLLSNKENNKLEEILEKALSIDEKNNFKEEIFNKINSILLTGIHCHSYLYNNKTFISNLFIVPYFTAPVNDDIETIHYPSVNQIENIFQKHFLENGLINEASELNIPTVKINQEAAEKMQFSDWFNFHKESWNSISETAKIKNQYYQHGFSFPIAKDGELNFFPLLITYQESVKNKPVICDIEREDLPFEHAIQGIESDLSILSSNTVCAIGVPTDFDTAIEFGNEIKQDFALNSFLKKYVQKEDIDLVILPLYEGQLGMFAWNNSLLKTDNAMEIYTYSSEEQEIVDYLLEQINFYDIKKTYLFETPTSIINIEEILHLNNETFHNAFENQQVIVLEKNFNNIKPTLH